MNDRISKPSYTHEGSIVIHGDSLDELKKLPDNSIDAVVTDPPYGLGNTSASNVADCLKAWANGDEWMPKGSGFMGKAWDAWVPPPALWAEVYRVLKHGGHALVFAGSRTQDLMSISMRLAGFELRDVLMWLYSSGMPAGNLNLSKQVDEHLGAERINRIVPITAEAKKWDDYSPSLKPSYEPIILAKKPHQKTLAYNLVEHGCGGLNIGGCRINTYKPKAYKGDVYSTFCESGGKTVGALRDELGLPMLGLYPANTLIDASLNDHTLKRYFYCSKPSKKEKSAGLADLNIKHPTMKPISLMRYLCRLITPKGGTILEPFAGSGTTLIASHLEGFKYIGIEREEDYVKIIRARLKHWAGIRDTSETKEAPAKGQLELFG